MQISCESAAVSEILPKIKMKLIRYMMDQVFFHVFSRFFPSYLTFSLTTVFGETLVAFLPLSTFFNGGLTTKL